MSHYGINVEVFENGLSASGYQVGFQSYYGYADVQTYGGTSLLFDSGLAYSIRPPTQFIVDASIISVQPPDRAPLSVLDGKVKGLLPAFHSEVGTEFSEGSTGIDVSTDDLLRVWFVRVSLNLKQMDDSNVAEKWIGGGSQCWDGSYRSSFGNVTPNVGAQFWYLPGQADPEGDWKFNTGVRDHLVHGYTDSSGICSFAYPVAWALRRQGTWTLYKPYAFTLSSPSDYYAPPYGTTPFQEIELYVERHGRHARKPWGSVYADTSYTSFPWYLEKSDDAVVYVDDESYRHGEIDLGAVCNYSSWNGVGGFTSPSPATYTHTYTQGVSITVVDHDGNPVAGVTVSFGTFSGTTNVDGEATVYGMPTGSRLAGIYYWLQTSTENLSEIPVQDATPFAGQSKAYLKASTYGPSMETESSDPLGVIRNFDFGPAVTEVVPATGSTFTITGNILKDLACLRSTGNFDGGEYLALSQTVTITDGSTTVTTEAVIYENEITPIGQSVLVPGEGSQQDGDDLDYAEGHFEDYYLVEARPTGIKLHESWNREQSFQHRSPIISVAQRLYSPSHVILPDHRHLIAVVKGGKVLLYRSDDHADYDTLSPLTIAEDATYAKVCLRDAPDEALIAWMVTDGGAVRKSISTDGGETWSASESVDSLPAGKAQRGDARHDGLQWLRTHVHSDGSLHLYASLDEDEWTEQGQIAPSGEHPWVNLLPDGSVRVQYHDGSDVKEKIGQYAGEAWTWGSANTVIAGGQPGQVSIASSQKVFTTNRDADFKMAFRRTYDQETWEDGAFG